MGAWRNIFPIFCICVVLLTSYVSAQDFPVRRSRMIIAPADRAALTTYADQILATKGGVNIASAYCYSLGTLQPNETLPTEVFCAPLNQALAGSGVLLHPVITFGGENAAHNFDKGAQFVELFLPEAAKNGYSGYYFDVEFHGSGEMDRKYHEFLHTIGTAFNAKNISITVLWRDSHSTPLGELNITGGVNSLSVELEGRHCSEVRTFIGAMGHKYKTKGGTLLYPKSEIDNADCINDIVQTLANSGAPELGYFANFNDMSDAWWAPMLKWVQGNSTVTAVNTREEAMSWRQKIPLLTKEMAQRAKEVAVRTIHKWQEGLTAAVKA